MYLEELKTLNFRNLETQTLKFKREPVVFYGANAQGKTNLLEAIYLLSTTKSFRTRSDHQLITWGSEQAKISGQAEHLRLELTVSEQKKQLRVNRQNKRLVDLIGSFVTVLFSPSDIDLIAGPPERRRRFLDQVCSNLNTEYLRQLLNFAKIVRARNQTLFKIRIGVKADLWVWDQQLAKSGSFIWHFREQTLKNLLPYLQNTGRKLLSSILVIDYTNPLTKLSVKEGEQKYLTRLEKLRGEEIARSQSLFGPHRDDFRVILEKESSSKVLTKDLGIFGSRGEQRLAALALKIGEVTLLQKERNLKPVLLLDEVLSELDSEHRKLLLNLVKDDQVFITATNLNDLKEVLGQRLQKFLVSSGKAEEIID